MRKILLNKKRSKKSVNKTNFIPVELNREMSLYHDEILTETVDVLNLYNEEKDKTTKHRFIFTLYPICTNVLFNKVSEIVYKEGSPDAKIITNTGNFNTYTSGKSISQQKFNRLQAIRNTEYSNNVFNMTYHCGADIFNNHLLRSKEDITVQKKLNGKTQYSEVYDSDYKSISSGSTTNGFRAISSDSFNTLGDVNRTYNGQFIYSYLPNSKENYTYKNSIKVNSPLYLYDTIKAFKTAFDDGVKRKDGWIGFNNPSTFNIPVISNETNPYYVNRCINNKYACEFIDMAPERDLFSFVPKRNDYRNRLEHNWDYYLTYPYENVYADEDNSVLIGKHKGLPLFEEDHSTYKEYISSNNVECAMFTSPIRHNLRVNDTVMLIFGENGEHNVKCKVVSIGNGSMGSNDHLFSIRMSDFYDYVVLFGRPTRFIKIVQGFECEYYFRKFKKIHTIPDNTITRLGFAGTIYGDEVSQIVYTDDIDISEYKDNRGRPLTELFLTIVKRNKGHELWYINNEASSSEIEYSHVFGKITSGLDLPEYISDKRIPVVRYQHNIDSDWVNENITDITINSSSSCLEDDVKIDMDVFYGDLVEFNPTTLEETILEDVYHRFNTAQREVTNNSLYDTIYYDEIGGDIYDANVKANTKTKIINQKYNEKYANLGPEGYIYRPHHKIKINEYNKIIKQASDTNMICSNVNVKDTTYDIIFNSVVNYVLLPNDMIVFVDEKYDSYKFRVMSYEYDSVNNVYVCKANLINAKNKSIINNLDYSKGLFFKHNLTIPEWAYMIPDGSGRHLWKEMTPPSEWNFTEELYTTPFTNGAFYHHKNITFPVRRQDPFQKYNMVLMRNNLPVDNNFEIPASEYDYSSLEHNINTNNTSCF
jgi:hypothetical protein